MSSKHPSLTRGLLILLAVASGISVANLYLSQPLLYTLGQVFHVSSDRIGLVATVTQAGYALGLFFLVPIGDIFPKKKLVLIKLLVLAVTLFLTGLSQELWQLLVGSLLIGVFSTVAQDLVPMAADLAEPKSRGQAVGMVASGLLLGILCSRTFSGFVADLAGWRVVFELLGAIVLILIVPIALRVPTVQVHESLSYGALLQSILIHIKTKPALRRAIFASGLLGLAFSAFWTNLSFFLGGPAFHLSNSSIGLFGIAGAAGAAGASLAGRIADRRGPKTAFQIGSFLVTVSFAGMLLTQSFLIAAVIGTVVFDLGMQMTTVSNQTMLFSLDPISRSRLNAVFMAGLFLFFSLGSLISVRLYQSSGWGAVLAMCLVCSALSFLSTFNGDSAYRARKRAES
jgi:predicted MFS family arabinose efflux permease